MAEVAGGDGPGAVYDGLAEADRKWLRQTANGLRVRLRRSVRDVVEAGRLLAAARRRLGRDRWRPWLSGEAQVPVRSASRLVAVGRVFGNLADAVAARFTPTALYALAEPGVPQSLREYAVEQATDPGAALVTEKLVGEWLAAYREAPADAPLALAPENPFPVLDADPARAFAESNWMILDELLGADNTLHLSRATDAENGERTTSGVLITGGKPRGETARTLEGVVLALAGEVRTKACRKCGEARPLRHFSTLRGSTDGDGRNKYCLFCERQRVKEYTRRKREGKA